MAQRIEQSAVKTVNRYRIAANCIIRIFKCEHTIFEATDEWHLLGDCIFNGLQLYLFSVWNQPTDCYAMQNAFEWLFFNSITGNNCFVDVFISFVVFVAVVTMVALMTNLKFCSIWQMM